MLSDQEKADGLLPQISDMDIAMSTVSHTGDIQAARELLASHIATLPPQSYRRMEHALEYARRSNDCSR
jgi:hypothetical protein